MKHFLAFALTLMPFAAQAQTLAGQAIAIDGDTLDMSGDRIRLHGVDALELTQICKRNDENWQCGNEAKAHLAGLIANKVIQCQQRDVDRYGRVVASCKAGNIDLSRSMVEAGYAVALSQFSNAYIEAEERLRILRFGMWGSEFQMPADYRAANPQQFSSQPRPAVKLSEKQRGWQAQSVTGVYYRNCDAARAAGVAPMYRGQPGYRPQLDGDNDGIACEPYRGR